MTTRHSYYEVWTWVFCCSIFDLLPYALNYTENHAISKKTQILLWIYIKIQIFTHHFYQIDSLSIFSSSLSLTLTNFSTDRAIITIKKKIHSRWHWIFMLKTNILQYAHHWSHNTFILKFTNMHTHNFFTLFINRFTPISVNG